MALLIHAVQVASSPDSYVPQKRHIITQKLAEEPN